MKHFHVLLISFILLIFYNNTAQCQWVHTPDYFSGGSIRSLAVDGTNLFTGTEFGVYLSTDNGTTWTAINNGIPATLIWYLKINGSSLYACTGGVGLFRTTDSGASWTNLGLVSELIYTCVVNGSAIFAGTNYNGIYRSTDDGTTWSQVNNGLNTIDVRALFVNGNSIFAGAFPGMYRSNDNGENWVKLTNGLPNPSVNIFGFTMIGSTLFASTGGGVYYSSDNGGSWNYAGLSSVPLYCIYSYLTNLFVSVTGDGINLSIDNGLTWEPVNEGLPSPVYPQSLLTSGDKIFLAASYDGLYWRPLSELVSSVESISGEVPKEFSLRQNYPNPFNPNTTISFSIPEATFVILEAFNTLGEKVAAFASEELIAGTYKYNWNAIDLPSGIYFYRLQAGSFVETKKMVLMK